MILPSMLADLGLVSGSFTIIAGVILVFVVFLLLYMIFSRYTKVGQIGRASCRERV